MKFREIFSFELGYQLRRPWPWLSMAVLAVFAFMTTRIAIVPVTLPKDFILNSPFIIASVTVFSCQIWLLIAPAVAGEAGARDVETGMYPLTYTSAISRAEYLGGRFLAAFALHALILLAVQLGSLLAAYGPGADAAIIGPFRPAAYVAAYGFIALTNVLIATTFQFAAALLSGRQMASYAGSLGLFFLSYPVTLFLFFSGYGDQALLVDPIGVFAIMNEMMSNWTIVEKNVRMFTLEGPMLWNRVLWVAIALATLACLYLRFRFEHRVVVPVWSRFTQRFARGTRSKADADRPPVPISVPQVRQSFNSAAHVRQTLAIATLSFRMIASSPAGLFLLAVFPMFLVVVLIGESEHWDVRLLPRTGYILAKHVTAPLTLFEDYRVIVPLLIVYFAGELVWRERDARISENIDAAPVPQWVLFLGKFAGLGLVLVALMGSLTAAGMLAQTLMGYHDYQPGLYLGMLFGLQLPEYLIFAVLAFLVHAVVNHKHVAMLLALVAYACIVFASRLGIEHNLLVYTAGPHWSYTDMRGMGGSLLPWLWFKLYWMAWAVLLAVAATLFWVRGREGAFRVRLQIARHRFTRGAAAVTAVAALSIVALGGFIFYNTNVLNEYRTEAETAARQAEYERRYAQYAGIPQPRRVATNLHMDIYPERGAATLRGSYRLANRDDRPIKSIHVETPSFVETRMSFDRTAARVLDDQELGHFIYELEEPLQPGETTTLTFEVQFEPRGFRNSGGNRPVVENGTYITSAGLPVIGYQPRRELTSPDDRRKHGLPRKVTFPTPDDVDPSLGVDEGGIFEAVIGTSEDQVAVAPGVLRRTWADGGRRYFHYGSDVPIAGLYVFFSADYAVHRERWNGVDMQVFLHPRHTRNLDRLLGSARASLDYYSEQFGAYPWRFLQIIEQPGNFFGMGVDGSGVVTGGEGFFLLMPEGEGVDVVFQVVAHEVAHLWWGGQLKYAPAEGAIVLSESLAWYSAMQVMANVNGPSQLRRFMSFMRQPNPWPPIRTGLPLLRAMDPWAGYRKGPYALYALSEYIGEERVHGALRSLLQKKAVSPATTLDLYRELQAATPGPMQYLLRDLFATNTFWEFATEDVRAKQTSAGSWDVRLDVRARKVVYDEAGVETDVPMNELIEIGVYGPAEKGGDELSAPLHVQKHLMRSGKQTITLTVSKKPLLAGIDPRHLLDWVEEGDDDNIERVEIVAP